MRLKRISFMRMESRFGSDLPNVADMLRYDVAFQSKVSPEYIAFPTFGTKDGNLGGTVTVNRWHTYGAVLRFLENEVILVLSQASRTKPDSWVTYRHPRTVEGPLDYKQLVPVTLEAYCQAKDPRDL